MRQVLRREANAQDISSKEGLEKARDADDALAQLQQKPPKAEDELRKAATATDKETQAEALKNAMQEQQKIAEALKNLSEHFNTREQGTKEEQVASRQELRRQESSNNQLKEKLDKRFAKAEALAEINQKTVAEKIDKKRDSRRLAAYDSHVDQNIQEEEFCAFALVC